MNRIIVCLDCPEYQKGGYCRHKRKDVSALTEACDHAKTMNLMFNPEDKEETMSNPLAPQAQTKPRPRHAPSAAANSLYLNSTQEPDPRTDSRPYARTATTRRHNDAESKPRGLAKH